MKGRFLKLTELKAKYLRNFDTFGQMDPFFRLVCGPTSLKTETRKEVAYKLDFTIRIDRQAELKVVGFEEDATEDQFCGDCTLKLSELAGKSSFSFSLTLQGEVTCHAQISYSIYEAALELTSNSDTTFYNIRIQLSKTKEVLGLGEVDPYLVMTWGKERNKTEVIEDIKGPSQWHQVICLTPSSEPILCEVFDSNFIGDRLICSGEVPASSLSSKGALTVKLLDSAGRQSGVLEMLYINQNIDLAELKKMQEEDRLRHEAEEQEKKKRADQKEKEKLQALRRLQEEEVSVPIYLFRFAISELALPKELEEESFAMLVATCEGQQSKFQLKQTAKHWQQLYTLSPIDKKYSPFALKIVFRNVLQTVVVSTKSIDPIVLLKDQSQHSCNLLNQKGERVGTITIGYSRDEPTARAALQPVPKAGQAQGQLKLHDFRLLVNQKSYIFDKDTLVAPTISCGGVESVLQAKLAQSTRTVWPETVRVKGQHEDRLKVTLKVRSKQVWDGQVLLSSLQASGICKIKLSRDNMQTATFIFLYAKGSGERSPPIDQARKESESAWLELNRVKINAKVSYAVLSSNNKQVKRTQLDQTSADSSTFSRKFKFALGSLKKINVIFYPGKAYSEIKLSEIQGLAEEGGQGIINLPVEGDKKGLKAAFNYNLVRAQQNNNSPSKLIPQLKQVLAQKSGSQIKNLRLSNSLQSLEKRLVQNYGDKIYQRQSSSTWQNSIVSYTIPKGARFKERIQPVEPSYYVANSINKNKYQVTTLGYGARKPYPQWMQRNMKQIPAPGAYNLVSNGKNFYTKGKTFGLPHSYFQKALILEEKNSSTASLRADRRPPVDREAVALSKQPLKPASNYHFLPTVRKS